MKRCLLFALLTLIVDQLSKWAVVEHVFKPELGVPSLSLIEWYQSQLRMPFVQVEILPFFNLAMVWNDGIGLGLMDIAGPWALIAMSLIICAILLVWLVRSKDKYLVLPVGLMVGGAIGNVIDRARYRAVVDFLDVHVGDWHYPTFNIADSAIVIGVFLLLLQPVFTGKVKP
jgi:signal peptidase II